MVTESMVLAEKLVHANTDAFDTEADFDNSAAIVNGELGADLGAFHSADELRADVIGGDDLEEFLRAFQEGGEDEAQVDTQGEADVGGEPTTTVH